uniref:Uncharacterized protein LOC111134618 isoform X1 n=1 Tax=Crassostrea virginica TaxID=6565 RepID=A0A8B8EFU4_CRAVI|nr:uncharacterized protein LOC111134618 isoform X1 [Crassostrea virginica]XP_022339508.1 uncharacterized protein LOC111134618 isoform X1 [Crassostrea virginica]XP_022339509.1 uncharacterized protein LOC111134618 isoform X1 [Crassostrea virginica]XP_022339510.1 uncharacterized protein LOC111134618 isoform X1 [Crassostrea virginica]
MKIFIFASMLAVVLCQEFHPLPKGKTCPDLPLGELYAVLDDCRGRDEPHCLTDDRHRHGLVCVEERDIQTEYCPYYNTDNSAMEERSCIGEGCPEKPFPSMSAVRYPGCYKDYRSGSRNDSKTRHSFQFDTYILFSYIFLLLFPLLLLNKT